MEMSTSGKFIEVHSSDSSGDCAEITIAAQEASANEPNRSAEKRARKTNKEEQKQKQQQQKEKVSNGNRKKVT